MTVYIDFETYYDKEVSLTKMTTIEYIKHPKFKVLGCAVITNNEEPQWFEGDTLPNIDWANETVVAHNMYFDGSVLWHHFGIKPKMWACTESMARGLIAWPSYALKSISKALGIGEKTEGLTEGADESDQKLIDYALNDVILCKQIYDLLLPHMPTNEMDLISLTMKWGIVAQLCIDIKKALKASRIASKARNELIATSGLPESLLASNKQFEGWIVEQGLNPPIKKNDKGLDTVALAKNDVQWVEFKKEHPHLQHVWEAREAAKSIIGIQRPRKLAKVAIKTPERLLPMPLVYYGAHTGRFSGRDYNVQNLDKKSGVRECIVAPKGHMIVVVDSSQIELRMNAWFSDEQWILDTLKNKEDVYCKTAEAILGKPVTKKDEQDRQFGKVCLAEGTPILTDKGVIPIEKITTAHRVWDGLDWVSHDGIVFNGIKEVITYDGVTATPEHKVYTISGRKISIRQAASEMDRLISTGDAEHAIRLANCYINRDKADKWVQTDSMPLCGNQPNTMDGVRQRNKRKKYLYDSKWQTPAIALQSAWEKIRCYKSPLYEPEQPELQKLWGSWDSMQIRFAGGLSGLCNPIFTTQKLQERRNRPNKQQWALRTEQLTIGDQSTKLQKSAQLAIHHVQRAVHALLEFSKSVLNWPYSAVCTNGDDWRRNYSNGLEGGERKTQELENDKTKARVYDIVNAGPRHRFTANNKLVANCSLGLGYGMGAEKFKDYCASGPLGMDPIELTEDEAISTIYKYRKANPAIVKSWKECDEVIRLMTQNVAHSPFKKNIAIEKTNIVLPNGMAIKYGNVYYEPQFESFVSYIKHNSKLYGAKIQENIVQALARIVVTDQILECERQGFNTVSSTHDEVLIIAKESEAEATLQQVIKIMSTPPEWCNDLPLGAEGKFKSYYSK